MLIQFGLLPTMHEGGLAMGLQKMHIVISMFKGAREIKTGAGRKIG